MFFELLFLAGLTYAADNLPAPFIRPCARDDPQFNACALESAKWGLPIMVKGDKKLGIPVLSPMHIPEIKVLQGTLSLTLTDLVLYGLEKAVPEKMDFNFEKKYFSMEFTLPEFKILSKYTANGNIVLLPISGTGDLNATMINGKLSIGHPYDIKKIKGVDHQRLYDMKAKFVPERVYFMFTNLFNGDKTLSTHMNKFLDENWKEVYTEIAPTIDSTFETIISSVMKSVNDIIPFDEIFPKKSP